MKNLTHWFSILAVFVLTFLCSFAAFAADAPAGIPALSAVHLALAGISSAVLAMVAAGLEAVFRILPTKKPLSILWVGVRALQLAIVVLEQVKLALVDLATIANRILPPEPVAPVPAPAQAPAQPSGA